MDYCEERNLPFVQGKVLKANWFSFKKLRGVLEEKAVDLSKSWFYQRSMKGNKRLKQVRFLLEELAVRAVITVTRLLPRKMLGSLSKLIGSLVYLGDTRSRDVAKMNLSVCQLSNNSPNDKVKCARQSICRFVHNLLELVWFARHVNGKNYLEYFDVADPSGALALEKSEQPLIFVTFHYGNFEMSSFFMGYHGKGTLVVQQETKNPAIGRILSELRVVGRNRPVGRTGVMLRLLKTLKRGGNIGILADLTLPPEKPSVIVDFLGLKMCVTRLHVELAMRTGAPIVMIIARPMPDGRYRLELCPPMTVQKGDSVEAAVQRCIDQLAEWVKQQPELWLWGYKHFRYLDPANPQAYPAYANEKKSFTKKMRRQQEQQQNQRG